MTACDCGHLEVLPLKETNVPSNPQLQAGVLLGGRYQKNELRIMCSLMALPTRAKKIFPSQLVSAIGRKLDGSVAGPDL